MITMKGNKYTMDMLEYEYEPNDMSTDMFLSEAPLNLMIENVRTQFQEPCDSRKYDHVQTFIEMYKYSMDDANVYEDEDMDNLKELRDKFYGFMQNILREYLNIGFNDFDEKSEEDQDHLIHYTYRFFITRIKKNFVSYVMNYLDENKTALFNEEIYNDQKDVTSLSIKREVTDPEDAYILSNLESIIKDIFSEDIDVDTFLEMCDSDNCLETEFVKDKYENFEITGNFVKSYVEMVDDEFLAKIQSNIRGKILKKYR